MLDSSKNTTEEIFKALEVSPCTDGKLQLNKEFAIDGIVIPQGYKTNGADIPRVFWSVIPPFKVVNLVAVVAHDYLCYLERYKEADEIFARLLNKFELEPLRDPMILAVKQYHRFKYGVKT